MRQCKVTRERFSAYLDGALTGVAMQQTAAHLESCADCRREFSGWRAMQKAMAELGPAKAPADLALRLRVAISQEHTHTAQRSLARWQVRWQNTFAPFLLRASAGFASAVLLVGTTALLVGAFASPQPVEARDNSDAATSPKFLYSLPASSTPFASDAVYHADSRTPVRVGAVESSSPVIVEAFVNRAGRVYDYRIISGPDTPASRAQIENMLLFSVFQPARVFGEPVRGVAVLSFSGVSVQG